MPEFYTSGDADRAAEVEKLARMISDELDQALIATGIIRADECLPFDALEESGREAIRIAARRIYDQLLYNSTTGQIVVMKLKPNASGS